MNKKTSPTQKTENIFFQKFTPQTAEPEFWSLTPEGELAINVYETAKEIIVQAAIAGVKPEDLILSLEDDLLTIRGTRRDEQASEDRLPLFEECYFGPFSRSVILPSHIKSDKTKARLQRGILLITLPKTKKETRIPLENLDE